MSAEGKLTLQNYRCFGWNNPATLEFGDGFTAFVGWHKSDNWRTARETKFEDIKDTDLGEFLTSL